MAGGIELITDTGFVLGYFETCYAEMLARISSRTARSES